MDDHDWDNIEFEAALEQITSLGPEPSIEDSLDYLECLEIDKREQRTENLLKLASFIDVSSPELSLIITRLIPILDENARPDGTNLFSYDTCLENVTGGTQEQYESLKSFGINQLDFLCIEEDLDPGVYGEMDPDAKLIFISRDLNLSNKIRVLSHELGHAILHSDPRVTWDIDYEQREVEAESVALLMCDHLGIDTNFASEVYIAGWMDAGEYVPALLLTSIEDNVIETVNRIKEGIELEYSNTIEVNFRDE